MGPNDDKTYVHARARRAPPAAERAPQRLPTERTGPPPFAAPHRPPERSATAPALVTVTTAAAASAASDRPLWDCFCRKMAVGQLESIRPSRVRFFANRAEYQFSHPRVDPMPIIMKMYYSGASVSHPSLCGRHNALCGRNREEAVLSSQRRVRDRNG